MAADGAADAAAAAVGRRRVGVVATAVDAHAAETPAVGAVRRAAGPVAADGRAAVMAVAVVAAPAAVVVVVVVAAPVVETAAAAGVRAAVVADANAEQP